MAGDNTSLKVRFLHLSIFLFLLTIYSSNYTSIHLYICLSIYLSTFLSTCLSIYPFIYLSIYSICLSNLSFYSSIYLIHKHDSNIVCFPLYFFTPSLPYSWFIIIVLFKMYTVQCTSIYLFPYSLIMGQPIKTTNSG